MRPFFIAPLFSPTIICHCSECRSLPATQAPHCCLTHLAPCKKKYIDKFFALTFLHIHPNRTCRTMVASCCPPFLGTPLALPCSPASTSPAVCIWTAIPNLPAMHPSTRCGT